MSNDDLSVFNYCLGFIDLLGQGDALRGQGPIPVFQNEADRAAFNKKIAETVGTIRKLQRNANLMVQEAKVQLASSQLRDQMPPEQQAVWDFASKSHLARQCWSDGLVYYSNMGDKEVRCRVNGIYNIFTLCGALYIQGLATGQPIRGGIDIAWAVELAPGEIYGAAVAGAYDLESAVAQYPRIVVGDRVVDFLGFAARQTDGDIYAQCDASLAKVCLDMLLQCEDGSWIIHVLGNDFRETVTTDQHVSLYRNSLAYIHGKLAEFRSTKNTKLAMRYCMLLDYFEHHKPA